MAEDQCPGAGKILDDKNGFRDAKLGAPFSSFSHMRPAARARYLTYRTNTVKAYERAGDDLEIFGQSLSRIVYYFFKNRLFLIRLEWSANVGVQILSGFGDAFACQPKAYSLRPDGTLRLEADGKNIEFTLFQRIGGAGEIDGWVAIERLGAERAIQAQIQREAAARF